MLATLDADNKGKDIVHTNRINVVLSLVLGGVVAAVAAFAWAQTSEEILLIEQPVDHDVYAASREVNVRSTVDGDLVAAGQRVTIDGAVTGDIIVAAQNIEIRAEVSDDLRVAGQYVRVMSPVAGHVVAAGQVVTVGQQIGDWAWLAGDTVEVVGNVGGDLKIRAKRISINAKVDGNADLIGDELHLGPDALMRGEVRWRSNNDADINPGAQIDGEFIREPLPGYSKERGVSGGLFFTLSVFVAVMVLFLLFSRQLRASADRVAARPGMSLLLGFAVLGATPLIALLLLVTRIGVWLGLAVLGTYLVVLLLGVLTGLFAASDLALRKFRPKPAVWQSLAAIFFTVVAVGLLTYVPYVGFIGVLTVWMLGVGALCWNTWVAMQASRLG